MIDVRLECCETCAYYYKDFGMPCCRKNDMAEEHPDEDKCGDYEPDMDGDYPFEDYSEENKEEQ